MATPERRKFARFHSWLDADYKVMTTGQQLRAMTHNTGSGGIGFFTESKLSPGTVLEVSLKFPGRPRPVKFTAQVTWSGKLLLGSNDHPKTPRAYETGVRFLDISPEDQGLIMEYARTRGRPLSS